MKSITGEGITLEKVETYLGQFHLYTFQTKPHPSTEIKKLKQYYLSINSFLHLTWPIYFTAFIANSLPSFPLISTPPRLETVCSALLWSPSHTLRCRSLGVGTMSAASCSPSTCEWAHCRNQQATFPGGCLHGLLGQSTCFPDDQTEKIKAASHSALIIHCCLGAVKRCVSQTWSLSWGAGSVSLAKTGARVVTTVPVCDQVISQKANQAVFLKFEVTFLGLCWLKGSGSGSEPLAQAAPQLRERFWHLQSTVHLTLPKTGVSCRKDQSFFRGTHFPQFIGERAQTTCLDYVSTHLRKLREESHLLGLMLQLY